MIYSFSNATRERGLGEGANIYSINPSLDSHTHNSIFSVCLFLLKSSF